MSERMARPKRSLSQNFLTAPGIARAIAREAARDGAPVAIEIGPGTGVLTRALLAERFQRVFGIEIDEELVEKLRGELTDPRLEIFAGDARRFTLAPLAAGKPYVIAANIPYHLTGTLLRRIFLERPLPKRVVLMVQWEVAQRLISPKMSLPALWVRLHGAPRIVRRVGAGSFFPKPNVDSAIVSISAITPNPLAPYVMDLARLGFSQRRKQLFAILRRHFPEDRVAAAFAQVGISPSQRAEDVSVAQWQALASSLHSSTG